MSRYAIVQKPPVFLDKRKSIASAVALVDEAAGNGADLVVFTEAFIPGYPTWIWRLRPGGDWNLAEELHARLLKNAVDLASDDLAPLMRQPGNMGSLSSAVLRRETTGSAGQHFTTQSSLSVPMGAC